MEIQTKAALDMIQLQEKQNECIQQFTSKTPLSTLITCLKPQSALLRINPQSIPLLNPLIITQLSQHWHQQIVIFSDLLYQRIQQKEINESLFIFVFTFSMKSFIHSFWNY